MLNKIQPEKKYTIGLVPHYVDKLSPWIHTIRQKFGNDCLFIDVENSANHVINEMKKCNVIVSSSLHGIICADSIGIPNIWCEISDKVVGKGFKFHDYNSSINYEQSPYSTHELGELSNIDTLISNKDNNIINNKQLEIEALLLSCIQKY